MNPATKDFVSEEPRAFRFKMGRVLASSLAGFIAGVIVASIVWGIGVWYINQVQKIPTPNPAINASAK